MEIIINKLYALQDQKYKDFNSKLIPNISNDKVIGVKVPEIRKLAKEIKDEPYINEFLNELPHKYQEENILHGILLPLVYKDIDELLNKLDVFLKYADNWAVTNTICPKLFKKYPNKVYEQIKKWLKSKDEYIIRFGVVSYCNFI